ncbi:hypothetical protein THAOC_18030 [Thalassiosira oceanica]|uniref:Uncharacterized protein n=1 Tax=Thalassiosira oceanica TaxID=159749 RepID=K0ST55_THAOC|nr:hypothetical protein THAOC_18030 [Thalassiosira oceanica]|eukprot:EJK61477.1 hypothetical protein THAOC_18030 [Thalassiosira oceanica]
MSEDETVENLRRKLASEKKRADDAQAKLTKLSDFVGQDRRRRSSSQRKGTGNGRGAMIRSQSIRSDFGNDRSSSVCQNIFRLMGYGGPNPDRELPDFWHSIFGILNSTRQSYSNALQKRILKKIVTFFKDEKKINDSNEEGRLCPTTYVGRDERWPGRIGDTALAETTWGGDGLRDRARGETSGPSVGDVTLDEEGIKVHQTFFRFMFRLKQREDYNELNAVLLDEWMDMKEDANLVRANKKLKKRVNAQKKRKHQISTAFWGTIWHCHAWIN